MRNVEVEKAESEEEVYGGAECGRDGWEEDPTVVAEEESLVPPWVALLVVLFPLAWVAFPVVDREGQTYSLDRTVEVPFGSFSPFPSMGDHALA